MIENSFYFRLSAVCAAVMLFIMCLDAARASPMTAQVDGGVKRVIVRRLHAPYSRPVFTGLQTAGTGIQSYSESEMTWNYRDRPSVSDHPSDALRFGKDSSSYIQNTPDDRWSRARKAGMRERPGNDVFTSYKHQEQRFERPPMIIRQSSPREAATLFKQEFHSAQVWEPDGAQKSLSEEKVKGKVAEDKALVSSPKTGRHWGTSLPTSNGHYGGYGETNELSSKIRFSKFSSLASQTAPRVPSVSIGSVASVIKSRETPASSGFHPLSSQTPKGRSFLFEHPQTPSGGLEMVNAVAADDRKAFSTKDHKQRLPSAHTYSRLSNFKQLERDNPREHPMGVHHISPVNYTANVGQYKYQDTTTADEPKNNQATGSQKSVISNLVNVTTRGSVQASKPGQTTKSIYGIRGFKNPAMKEPSNLSSSNHSFKKGRFKMANVHPYLSAKYSFGQRDASTTPDKHEETPVDFSSPSPGSLDIVQNTTTLRSSLMGFKEDPPRIPENDAGVDQNPDPRQLKIYRKVHHLKGFDTPPLEGAKPLIDKPDKPARVQQGYEEFKPRSSQIWQAESSRIHRWYNKTEPGSSQSSGNLTPLLKRSGSIQAGIRFTPDKYKESRKVYTHLGFHPVQRGTGKETSESQWAHQEQTPANHRISSAYLRSAWDLKVEPGSKSEPRPPSEEKPVSMKARLLGTSTGSMVRGKRVRGNHGKKLGGSSSLTDEAGKITIVRLTKRPPTLKAVIYTDILGSASFSGVRAAIQTPTTADGKAYPPNATATTQQEEGAGSWRLNPEDAVHNMSRGPEAEGGFGSAGDDVSGDLGTSNSFLDNSEGSGSGGLNVTDGLSNHTQRLGGDLLERDYLRISTGNMSFKSLKLSHTAE